VDDLNSSLARSQIHTNEKERKIIIIIVHLLFYKNLSFHISLSHSNFSIKKREQTHLNNIEKVDGGELRFCRSLYCHAHVNIRRID
jgi:hypothetical protein